MTPNTPKAAPWSAEKLRKVLKAQPDLWMKRAWNETPPTPEQLAAQLSPLREALAAELAFGFRTCCPLEAQGAALRAQLDALLVELPAWIEAWRRELSKP